MRKAEIVLGGRYLAKVSGQVVVVRVFEIRKGRQGQDGYRCVNHKTGRKIYVKSAARFRGVASPTEVRNKAAAHEPFVQRASAPQSAGSGVGTEFDRVRAMFVRTSFRTGHSVAGLRAFYRKHGGDDGAAAIFESWTDDVQQTYLQSFVR